MPWKRLASGKGLSRLLTGGGLFFLLSLPVTGHTETPAADAPTAPLAALKIDQTLFTATALNRMLALVQRDDPGLTREQFIDAVIESHLVANHVRRQSAVAQVLHSSDVGFSPRVQVENRQIATLRALYAEPMAEAVQALGDSGLNALLEAPIDPDMADVATALGNDAPHVYQLDDARALAADNVLLARFRFPQQEQVRTVTLGELYRRQNVQGRMALHGADRTWLVREIQLYIGQQFVRWWTRHHSGSSAATLAAIDTLVEDRLLRQAWLAHTGVAAEIHTENPALTEAAAQVTDTEIRAWYQQHRQRFREVQAARARVVRCAEKAPCDALDERLAQAAEHGVPGDGMTTSTQWYQRGETQDWLTDVVLMQPGAQQSRTIRAPGGGHWYRIEVLERQWYTHPPDSRTVDIVARRELGRQRLVARYLALTERLRREARIERPAS